MSYRKWAIQGVVMCARLRQGMEYSEDEINATFNDTSWHEVCRTWDAWMIQKNARWVAPKCSEKNIQWHDIFDTMSTLFRMWREHEWFYVGCDLRRLAYADRRLAAILRVRRRARSEFFGFNYNIALTDIMGIFRGILIDGALASIMVELYIDMILRWCNVIQFRSHGDRVRCGGLFRLLFDHLQAGVAVILAIVIIVIYGWTQRIQGQTEICTEVMVAVWWCSTIHWNERHDSETRSLV